MVRLFLIGALCGMMLTAAVTFVLAMPANSDHWRMEIWERGGAAWTSDKNGHLSWKWLAEPVGTIHQQRKALPATAVNVRSEQL